MVCQGGSTRGSEGSKKLRGNLSSALGSKTHKDLPQTLPSAHYGGGQLSLEAGVVTEKHKHLVNSNGGIVLLLQLLN